MAPISADEVDIIIASFVGFRKEFFD